MKNVFLIVALMFSQSVYADLKSDLAQTLALKRQMYRAATQNALHPMYLNPNLKKAVKESIEDTSKGESGKFFTVLDEENFKTSVKSSKDMDGSIKTFVTITANDADGFDGQLFHAVSSDLKKLRKVHAASFTDGKLSFTIKLNQVNDSSIDVMSDLVKKYYKLTLTNNRTMASPVLSKKAVAQQVSRGAK